MNTSENSNASAKPSLNDFIFAIRSVVQCVVRSDISSGKLSLSNLRKLAFLVSNYFARSTDEEVHTITTKEWANEFTLLKLSLQSDLTRPEEDFISELIRKYEENTNRSTSKDGASNLIFARLLILCRLLVPPYRLNKLKSWHDVPKDYLKNFITYQLELTPAVLPKDAERSYLHYNNVLEKLLEFITSPITEHADRDLAINIFLKYNLINFNFNDLNMCPTIVLMNKVMREIKSHVFGSKIALDQPFLPRSNSKKIRIAVFAKTLMAGIETFAMLTNISKLDRNKYHIILLHSFLNHGYYSEIGYYRDLLCSVDEIYEIDPSLPLDYYVEKVRQLDLDILWHQSSMGLMDTGWLGFLFLHKLARIQCSMCAMNGFTSGNPNFQYYFNMSPPFLPKTWEGEFSEKEITVPSIVIDATYTWKQAPNQIITSQSLSIRDDAIIYFSGAPVAKYTTECIITWLQIIQNVPNSYLILCPFNPGWSPNNETVFTFHAILQLALKTVGDVSDRVRVLEHVNSEAISLIHKWGNIHLSSFPYGGVTTLNDSLRNGLCPVCTAGDYSHSNGDASIMAGYGLIDLVTRNTDEYKKLAIRYGMDKDFRQATKLRVQESYERRHPFVKEEIAKSYATIIDEIVELEFPDHK